MKKILLSSLALGMMLTTPAFANDLAYMINPPKEKSLSELQTEIAREKKAVPQNPVKLAELRKELQEAVSDVQPAAGPGTKAEPTYDHVLGH